MCELAQRSLWNHWFEEYGEDAREALVAADGDAAKLMSVIKADFWTRVCVFRLLASAAFFEI